MESGDITSSRLLGPNIVDEDNVSVASTASTAISPATSPAT